MRMVTHMTTPGTIIPTHTITRIHMARPMCAIPITIITGTITMLTIMRVTFTTSIAGIRTARSQARLPVLAAGRAD